MSTETIPGTKIKVNLDATIPEDEIQIKKRKRKSKKSKLVTEENNPITPPTITVSPEDEKDGHFEGSYWVWPDGKRTHIRFLTEAVIANRVLPKGFFTEAEKSISSAVRHLAHVALDKGIPEQQ